MGLIPNSFYLKFGLKLNRKPDCCFLTRLAPRIES